MNNKEDNYKVQNGCYNCELCFIKYEYDDANAYYCHDDNSKRPSCGSVAMNENFFKNKITDKEFHELDEAWENWSKTRRVDAWGICDKWRHE